MKDRMFKLAAFMTSMVLLMVPTSLNVAYACVPRSSTAISGTWRPDMPTVLAGFSNFQYIGRNVYFHSACTGEFVDGPITGTFSQTLFLTLNYDDPAKVAQCKALGPGTNAANMGSWPVPNTFEFTNFVREVTGSYMDKSGIVHTGTFEMYLLAYGHGMPVVKGPTAFDLRGIWVIAHGTGGLAGLHGYGTWWHTTSMTPVPFAYQGQVYFDS